MGKGQAGASTLGRELLSKATPFCTGRVWDNCGTPGWRSPAESRQEVELGVGACSPCLLVAMSRGEDWKWDGVMDGMQAVPTSAAGGREDSGKHQRRSEDRDSEVSFPSCL